MNLGNKTLNDLISKDNSAVKGAAIKLLAEKDVESFKILNSKSEFLFDFIQLSCKISLREKQWVANRCLIYSIHYLSTKKKHKRMS